MKKIFITSVLLLLVIIIVVPISALGTPSIDGAYNPPPSPNNNYLTSSFVIMRSYSNVSTIFISPTPQNDSANVDGYNLNYYPTFLFSTPDEMVSPNTYGFGNISDYSSTTGYEIFYTLQNLNGDGTTFPSSQEQTAYLYDHIGTSYTYVYPLTLSTTNAVSQFGAVSGEVLNGDFDTSITGYSIQWSESAPYTVSVTGSLSYYVDGSQPRTINIDRSYNLSSDAIFDLNPRVLLSDSNLYYDYYLFYGSWTVTCSVPGYIFEYKSYDSSNGETFDFLDGYNEYTDQIYSHDLYPMSRILNIISSSSVLPPTGNINITQNGQFDVSQFATATVTVPQEILEDVNAFNWLYGAIEGVLTLEIAPDFSIGVILLFIAGFAIIVWILKVYFGG